MGVNKGRRKKKRERWSRKRRRKRKQNRRRSVEMGCEEGAYPTSITSKSPSGKSKKIISLYIHPVVRLKKESMYER